MQGNGEREAREIRGDESRVDQGSNDSDREEVTRRSREEARLVGVGATGADSAGPIGDRSIAGGIIGQLIAQCEDRLTEAEECISWYQREVEKVRGQLANLEALRQLAEQEQTSEE